ncbi:unnamed protein product [Penicillium viridicatum]
MVESAPRWAGWVGLWMSGPQPTAVLVRLLLSKHVFPPGQVFCLLLVQGPLHKEHKGREEVIKMLEEAHNGIREELQTRAWAQGGETVLAELDGVFVSEKDTPQHFFYAFKKGEKVRFRFLAAYTVVGRKISHIRITYWASPLSE